MRKPQIMIDAQSLKDFIANRKIKVANKNMNISVTCTRHHEITPMILTKNGYECISCNSIL